VLTVSRYTGEPVDLSARTLRVGVQEAYYVGDIFVGEARVLLAESSWVKGGLGG
jgi:hypothetical protein